MAKETGLGRQSESTPVFKGAPTGHAHSGRLEVVGGVFTSAKLACGYSAWWRVRPSGRAPPRSDAGSPLDMFGGGDPAGKLDNSIARAGAEGNRQGNMV